MSMDPLDRLAAANPLPEPERLTEDERRERDELLARVTASPAGVGTRAQRARPSQRAVRRPVLALALACVMALAALAGDLLHSEDAPGPNVVERALAALSGDDVIYHAVAITRTRSHSADPRVLDAFASFPAFGNRHAYLETWHAPDGRFRLLSYRLRDGRRGALELEQVTTPRGLWTYYGDIDRVSIALVEPRRGPRRVKRPRQPSKADLRRIESMPPQTDPRQDLAVQLRALYEQGRLRLTGERRFDGRRAYTLDSGLWVDDREKGHTERVQFVVDAETYLPIEVRTTSTQLGLSGLPPRMRPPKWAYETPIVTTSVTRYLVYEKLEPTPENLRNLRFGPHPGAKVIRSGGR